MKIWVVLTGREISLQEVDNRCEEPALFQTLGTLRTLSLLTQNRKPICWSGERSRGGLGSTVGYDLTKFQFLGHLTVGGFLATEVGRSGLASSATKRIVAGLYSHLVSLGYYPERARVEILTRRRRFSWPAYHDSEWPCDEH